MRTKILFVLILVGFIFATSCDSESTKKYLEFATDTLLPQAPIGKAYDFTFTVTYGDDMWNAETGYTESDIVWGFDNWKLNGFEQTEGPTNFTFSDGQITGTPDDSEGGFWSFDVSIGKGKTTVVKRFYLPVTQNIEILTQSELPTAVTDLEYSTYFSAQFGSSPYFWTYENWTKDGSPVSDAPVGLACSSAGYISGLIDHSEAGKWTVDVTVYDASIPNQLSDKKTFEIEIKLKITVPTNYPTIQAAVDFAPSGETIYLEAGTFKGVGNRDINFNGKSLTILGNPQDPGTVIIDCEGTSSDPHRAFYFAMKEKDCVLDGFTVINGSAKKIGNYFYGGAVFLDTEIELTIQNVNFKDIISKQTASTTIYLRGGVIYAGEACDLTLENVNTENIETTLEYPNSSGSYVEGQIIRTETDTLLTIEDCTFDGGYAEGAYFRGLIYVTYNEYSMKNVVFKNFESSTFYYVYNYGLFYLNYSEGSWENVSVVNNRVGIAKNATNYANGFCYGYGYWNYSDIVLRDCVFANNVFGSDNPSLSYWGGYGIYLYRGTSEWYDCVFACNKTDTSVPDYRPYGFLMRIYYNDAKFYRCHFVNNRAPSTYVYTTGYTYGGMIQVYYGDAVFNECVFAYNESGVGAGVLQASYSMTCTANNCTFYKNAGFRGGALFYYYATTLNNCVIWDNTASNSGNAIYGYSTSYQLTMNNSLYSNQSGDVSGGSINPVSCVNTNPFFKDTGDNVVTGDCTFSDVEMTVTGTPGTSAFLSEIKRGDGIYLTADGEDYALFVLEVVSDSELKVAGYYKGTPGTGAATVKKLDFTPQHTSKGDANDSPCVDAGDNSKITSTADIIGNSRVIDGNGNGTPTVDMGAYEMQ